MATVRKRGNSYQIRVSCGYDLNGNQVEQSMTWKPDEKMTEKQIEKELNRQAVLFEEACMKGNVVATIKFEDFARQWFKEYAEVKLKQRTVEGYHQMEKRIYKAIGHIRLDKLTTRHIQKFILELCDAEREDGRNRNGGKFSAKTIKLHISMISTIFDYAIKMQLIQHNPCRAVTLPKPDGEKREVYTLEEVQQLFEAFKDDECELCVHIAAFYGLRRSEVIGLKWDAVDFENKTITIKHKVTEALNDEGKYELVIEDKLKNQSSHRTMPLIPHIEEMLIKEKKKQDRYRKLCGKSYSTEFDGYICRKTTGELIKPNYFSDHFKWILKKHNLRKIRLHDLRHTCASLLLKNGVQMKQIQEWLGHSSFNTTANTYSHLDYSSKIMSAETMEKILGVV